MKRTLSRPWVRIRLADGHLVYHTPVSESFITQVWRDGGFWRWAAVGFTDKGTPLIAKHGTASTMNEAQWYAERWLPPINEQTVMSLV